MNMHEYVMVVTKHRNSSGENPDGGTNHRSDPNNQAEDERQIQKPVGDLIIVEAQQAQGEGLGILRGVGGREARETGESVLPWTGTVENAGSRRWRDRGNFQGERTRKAGTVERISRGDRGTVGDFAEDPWNRGRDTVEQVSSRNLGNRAGAGGLENTGRRLRENTGGKNK